jgi:hypothetical protein
MKKELKAIKAIQILKTGNIVELADNQVFLNKEKSIEIWQENTETETKFPLILIKRFRHSQIGFIWEA